MDRKEAKEVLERLSTRYIGRTELYDAFVVAIAALSQPSNEPLTCDGCYWGDIGHFGQCVGCIRGGKDHYRRPSEGKT